LPQVTAVWWFLAVHGKPASDFHSPVRILQLPLEEMLGIIHSHAVYHY
jgi:hypothetical protein